MEGAEHYREAELLLAGVDPHGKPRRLAPTAEEIARAQVHATLALAAAQIAPLVHQMMGDSPRVTEWGRVINWGQPSVQTTRPFPQCRIWKVGPETAQRCLRELEHDGDHDFEGMPF